MTFALLEITLNHMVEHQSTELDAVFHALADPTRRSMLSALAKQASSVSELAQPHAMSLAGASKHVRVLERAGLVRRSRAGRYNIIRLDPVRLEAAQHWITHYLRFWRSRLDALETAMDAGRPP